MDIQPSDAAIHDRAINYVRMGRGKIPFCRQLYLKRLSFKHNAGLADQTIVDISPGFTNASANHIIWFDLLPAFMAGAVQSALEQNQPSKVIVRIYIGSGCLSKARTDGYDCFLKVNIVLKGDGW